MGFLKRQVQAPIRSNFQQTLPLKRIVTQTITQRHLVVEMTKIPGGEEQRVSSFFGSNTMLLIKYIDNKIRLKFINKYKFQVIYHSITLKLNACLKNIKIHTVK